MRPTRELARGRVDAAGPGPAAQRAGPAAQLPQPGDARLWEICEHLEREPDDDTTLDAWARRVEVASKTMQRSFSKETGMTFGQWEAAAAPLRALELLATGEKVVDALCSWATRVRARSRRCSSGNMARPSRFFE